jgi:hypothetical protein
MGLIDAIFELLILPFKIVAALVEITIGLIDAIFTTSVVLIDAILSITVFLAVLPFRILGAILPPYGGGPSTKGDSKEKSGPPKGQRVSKFGEED